MFCRPLLHILRKNSCNIFSSNSAKIWFAIATLIVISSEATKMEDLSSKKTEETTNLKWNVNNSYGELKRSKRTVQCDTNWLQVGSSCYFMSDFEANWDTAVEYCTNLSSTLPIFYNATEYVAFANWWNSTQTSKVVWLGLTYDPTKELWTWMNNCSWLHFPSFWRICWSTGCGVYNPALTNSIYYTQYSNKDLGQNYVKAGAEPVLASSSAVNQVVCYKPIDETPLSCYQFPKAASNFLCSDGSWWCASENPSGQSVTTAIQADSCFCLHYSNETVQSAEQSCSTFNMSLADIRNDEEKNMIVALINDLIQDDTIQAFMCPTGFSYFNQSCFFVANPPTWSGTEGPGKAANDYCISHYSALSASLHSFDEQWFLYHLYLSEIGYFYGQWIVLGSYKTNFTDNSLRSYHWYDGSPFDFIPEIAVYEFNYVLDNNEYYVQGVTMVLDSDNGNIGDSPHYYYQFACRKNIPKYDVYPVLFSSVYSSSQTNILLHDHNNFSSNTSAEETVMSKLCRKDRIAVTTTSPKTTTAVTTTSPKTTTVVTTTSPKTTTTVTTTSPKTTTAVTTTSPKTTTAVTTTSPKKPTMTTVISSSTLLTTTMRSAPKNPMTHTEQVIAKVLSALGCTWIIITTAISFFVNIILGSKSSFSLERKVHMSQELSLLIAHVFILALSSRVDLKVTCNFTSLALQYLFTSYFIFLLVESLQTYCIYTNVISNGQFLSTLFVGAVGFGIPFIFVVSVALFAFEKLSSTFTCFVNYGDIVCLAVVLPGLIICLSAIVIVESTGMGDYKNLPLTNPLQMYTAIMSKNALFFKMPLSIASWLLMTVGLHYQKLYWFTSIFGVNIALGWYIAAFHSLGAEEIKRCWIKLRKKINC